MKLITLDSTCHLDKIVENHSSLIWTERYRKPAGDFQLETKDISNTLALLPLGTLVSHQDTRTVYIVETREISTNDKSEDVLKITGRCSSTIMEKRAAIYAARPLDNPTTGDPYQWEITSTASVIVNTLLNNHLVTGTIDAKDAIPNIIAATNTLTGDISSYRLIPRGNLYDAVMQILEEFNAGFSTFRPANMGTSGIAFSGYQGIDKTSSVILQSANGDFTTTKYYESIEDYVTTVYGAAPRVYSNLARSGTSTLTGFARRVELNDCPDIKSSSTTNEGQMLAARNRSFLTKTNIARMFECSVSPTIPYVYGQHYNLGDKIKCIADYGIIQNMMVNEYIRIDDEKGDRGYPSLITY